MSRNNRRGSLRQVLIAVFSTLTAGTTATLAMLHKSMGQGLAIAFGYAILIMSAVLIQVSLSGSTSVMRRTALLIFMLGILVFFLGGIIYILFTTKLEEPAVVSSSVMEEALPASQTQTLDAGREGASLGQEAAVITPTSVKDELPASSTEAEIAELLSSFSSSEEEGKEAVTVSLPPEDVKTEGENSTLEIPLNESVINENLPEIAQIDENIADLAISSHASEIDTAPAEAERSVLPSVPEAFNTVSNIQTEAEIIEIERPLSETQIESVQDEVAPRVPSAPSMLGATASFEAASPEVVDIEIERSEETVRVPSAPALFNSITSYEPSEPEIVNISKAVPSAPEVFNLITSIEYPDPVVVDIAIPRTVEEIPAEEVASEPEVTYSVPRRDTYDDDFWSTFFVQGEDELFLEDGFYYVDLYINQMLVGTIETLVEAGKAYISSEGLHNYIYGNINDDIYTAIYAYSDDYIAIEYLNSIGVQAEFDSAQYRVLLTFSAEDMPVQILSISGVTRNSIFHPIAGGTTLNPAFFVIRSNWSFTTRINSIGSSYFSWEDSLRFQFASTHSGRISDVYFNFGFDMYFTSRTFEFSLRDYEFHKDFKDAMIRLRWGNISTNLLSPRGTAVGIGFDRNFSYASAFARRQSHIERMLLVEKESRVIVYNEGREIYNRVVQPGNYRLQDFVLYTGANEIIIRVEPMDGSMPTEQTISLSYASSLLAPGEVYYGASIATGRQIVNSNQDDPGAFYIPIGSGRYLKYDAKNITLSGYVRAGLTETLTIDSTLSLQNYPNTGLPWNPRARLNTELTHANFLGTTRYNLNLREEMDSNGRPQIPGIYARIGHQVSTGWSPISSISIAATYASPEENGVANRHRFSTSLSIAGRVGILNWSTSISGTLYSDSISRPTYSANGSMSVSLARNFWVSGSISINGQGMDLPRLYGSVYATVRFNGGSSTVSTGFDDAAVSVNVGNNTHSFSGSIRTDNFAELSAYDISADYSYSGKYLNFDFDASSNLSFNSSSIRASVSTSTVFADGLFALGGYIPTNFLLIQQTGNLRGNELTAGVAGSSRTTELASSFGTYIYTGLSTARGTAFSLYSTDPEGFNGSTVFDINVPFAEENGYVLRLHAENRYSVSGVVELEDGSLWMNGSSPLYAYSEIDGEAVLSPTDAYLFTDSEGRFTATSLLPGVYAFDINSYGEWILAIFEVSDLQDFTSGIQLLQRVDIENEISIPEIYASSIYYVLDEAVDSDTFWYMLYPEMREVAV